MGRQNHAGSLPRDQRYVRSNPPAATAPPPATTQQPSLDTAHGHPDSSSRPHPPVYPLGTREDVERDDYQSPLAHFFGRAYDRFRLAEQHRRELAAQTASTTFESATHPAEQNIPVQPSRSQSNFHTQLNSVTSELSLPPLRTLPTHAQFTSPLFDWQAFRAASLVVAAQVEEEEIPDNAIDRQANRPTPLSKEEMTISIACRMCMEQKIDTLIEPCMHLAMCRWCSDVWQKNARLQREQDPNARDPWKCPMCRRGIRQVRRVYF